MLEGVEMADSRSKPRALFLFPSSKVIPDDEICSGRFPSSLKGKPCPYSDRGRIPLSDALNDLDLSQRDGEEANRSRTSSCSLQRLGPLEEWVKKYPLIFPEGLGHKMLFKCRQMFFVILLDWEFFTFILLLSKRYFFFPCNAFTGKGQETRHKLQLVY